MGCNSHLLIEVCHEYAGGSDGKPVRDWGAWATDIYESRDYVIYGLMAEVRNRFKESFKERGFPKDASEEAKVFFGFEDTDGNPIPKGNSDYHSYSWLTPLEFYQVCMDHEKILKKEGYDSVKLHNAWAVIGEVLLVLAKRFGSNNVRLVFAFDN